jgi:hypothetical protein
MHLFTDFMIIITEMTRNKLKFFQSFFRLLTSSSIKIAQVKVVFDC